MIAVFATCIPKQKKANPPGVYFFPLKHKIRLSGIEFYIFTEAIILNSRRKDERPVVKKIPHSPARSLFQDP